MTLDITRHHLPLAAVTLDRHLPLASEHRSSVDLGVPHKRLDAFPKILSHVMLKCDHSIYVFEGNQHHKRWIPILLFPWRQRIVLRSWLYFDSMCNKIQWLKIAIIYKSDCKFQHEHGIEFAWLKCHSKHECLWENLLAFLNLPCCLLVTLSFAETKIYLPPLRDLQFIIIRSAEIRSMAQQSHLDKYVGGES